jgi:hypothetical protein
VELTETRLIGLFISQETDVAVLLGVTLDVTVEVAVAVTVAVLLAVGVTVGVLVGVSRESRLTWATKMSVTPFVSPGTRFVASDSKTRYRPSADSASSAE